MEQIEVSNKSSDPRLQAYTALRKIGKGSYGEVFLVRHSRERKQYVMKNIKLTASSAKERLAAEQEAVLLGKLKHPNIVSYKESFQDELGMLHIIMGYCEGGDLCTRLKSHQGHYLPETQVVEWFVQIALGLQYLHDRNILHRDLKTQNIFLSRNDIIKVGDLGIARVLDGSCDLAHTVIGTPYYMSPELFANEAYNHKSDIWALGCCVYEMATLKHAFTANNLNALMYKIIKGKVPALPGEFSSDLSEIVHLMTAHSADRRPSVHDLLRNPFVRRHIKLFLERAAGKKKRNKTSSRGVAAEEKSSTPKARSNSTGTKPSAGSVEKPQVAVSVDKPSSNAQLKKPPRPLPPDPVKSSGSGTGDSKPPQQKSPSLKLKIVSSARERRRRSKLQEGGGVKGRVVLKSRSSSDLASSESRPRRGSVSSADDPTELKNEGSQTELSDEKSLPSEAPCGEKRDEQELRDSGSSTEVDDFLTLLDSTLQAQQASIQPQEHITSEVSEIMLHSGRLGDRIVALRRECVLGLGEVLMTQASTILNKYEPEEAEEFLLEALGQELFEQYAGKLQHLNFCEDNVITP